MKRIVLSIMLAGLGLAMAGVIVSPAAAHHTPDAESCGTDYAASVQVGYIHHGEDPEGPPYAEYCSDGTFQELGVPANGDGESDCGGNYLVTIEFDTIDLPGHGISYCSDGTIDGIKDALPESPIGDPPSGESCGGAYAASVQAGSVTDPTNNNSYSYCSDGTLQDLGVPENGDGSSGCGGNYHVTVEFDTIDLPGHGISYCSDGTIDGINDLLPPA